MGNQTAAVGAAIQRTCNAAFRTNEGEAGKRYIEGYFAVFGDVYDIGEFFGTHITESIDPSAFNDSIGGDIRVLANHDTTLVLGRTRAGTASVRVDDHGVYVRCRVNPEDTDAMNVYARLKRGDVSQASFGAYVVESDRAENTDEKTVHYTLRKLDVFEFSVCTFPAYEGTNVGARGSLDRFAIWKNEMRERIKKWGH